VQNHINHYYQQIFEKMGTIMLLIDPRTGAITDANAAAEAFYGYTKARLTHMDFSDLTTVTPEHAFRELLSIVAAHRAHSVLQQQLASGEIRDVEVTYCPVEMEGKRLLCTIVNDITMHKRAAERSALALSSGKVFQWDWNLQTEAIIIDPALKSMLGFEDHEIANNKEGLMKLVHPSDAPQLMDAVGAYLDGAASLLDAEARFLHKNSSTRWFICRGTAQRISTGIPEHLIGILIDITNHKIAEEALRATERRFLYLFKHVLFHMDMSGEWKLFNHAWTEITGFSVKETAGTLLVNYVHPEDRQRIAEEFHHLIAGDRETLCDEVRFLTKQGEPRWVEIHARTSRDERGKIDRIIGTLWDITRRRRAEEDLIASEQRYRALFEESKDIIFISTPGGRLVDINPAGIHLLGYASREDILSIDLNSELFPTSEEQSKFIQMLEHEGSVKDYELKVRRKDGEILTMLVDATLTRDEDGSPLLYRGMMRDITHQKRIEQQLLHSQKMEAIGQLAGGVAHDFNNILTGIMGYGELIRERMNKDDPLYHFIDQIVTSSKRAANLIQSLIAFSRKQQINPELVDLDTLVKGVEELLKRLIGEDIELKTELTDENLPVMADSGQIEQALMHLATNARDSMPHGGVLTIKTELRELDREFKRIHGFGEPGAYAVLLITDTGMGIDEKTRKRIFEPFFSTKDVGKGIGLGLSIVYGIVKQHNGYIDVQSQLGKGTTFMIYLPVIQSRDQLYHSMGLTMPKGGKETILLTEDDEVVLDLIRSLLEGFGYTVILAKDGQEAVQRYLEHKDSIKLLILDVVMPKKTGKEVYDEIKRIQPDIKVIFISGYDDDIVARKGIFAAEQHFIAKPFSTKFLLDKIREVLDTQY
jgi:PAS domain S-box-containing protein